MIANRRGVFMIIQYTYGGVSMEWITIRTMDNGLEVEVKQEAKLAKNALLCSRQKTIFINVTDTYHREIRSLNDALEMLYIQLKRISRAFFPTVLKSSQSF